MCKKDFGIGLAVMYLFSTICYPVVLMVPLSGRSCIQVMGLLSVAAAIFCAMRDKGNLLHFSFKSLFSALNQVRREHKCKFMVFICFLILMLLIPEVLTPVASFLGDLIDFMIEHVPFLDLIPIKILGLIIMELNMYAVLFYALTYLLVSGLFCKSKNTLIHAQK